MPEALLRAFIGAEVAANPMFAFRLGVTYLVGQRDSRPTTYVELARTTLHRLQTEDPVFARQMNASESDDFQLPGLGQPLDFSSFMASGMGGPMMSLREQTMAEMNDTLARMAEEVLRRGDGRLAASLALGGLLADYELVGTRLALVSPEQELPTQTLTGILFGLVRDAPAELTGAWFDALLAGWRKGAPSLNLPETLILSLAGRLVRSAEQETRLLAFFDELDQRLVTVKAPAARRALSPFAPPPPTPRLSLLLVRANYLARVAERPADARRLLDANLQMGPEVRAHYLTYFDPSEVLDVLLRWTGPGAPGWAVVERPQWLRELISRAQSLGRPEVVREAALRQLRDILTTPGRQPWEMQQAWQLVRGTYPAVEWSAARPALVSDLQRQAPKEDRLPANDLRRDIATTLDKFDRATDNRLAEMVKRPRFAELQDLAPFWLPDRAAALAALYARALPDYLEDSNNKTGVVYQQVAEALWRLVQYVEAEEPIVALVDDLATRYARRRLLLEALRTVGFSVGKPGKAPRNGNDDEVPPLRRVPKRR